MITEPFAWGNTTVHKLDPRYRIFFVFLYSVLIAVSGRFSMLIIAMAISFAMIICAKLELKIVFKRLLIINGFNLFMWVILPVTVEGRSILSVGLLDISMEGVVLSGQITLKSNAIMMAFLALATTMTTATLGHALTRLRVPGALVHLLLMTYRYLFVLEQEYLRLLRSAKIRGFQPGSNLHTYRTYAHIVGMLFVKASNRAERVHHAMLCRGFSGKFYSLMELKENPWNNRFAALMTVIMAGLVMLEWRPLV